MLCFLACLVALNISQLVYFLFITRVIPLTKSLSANQVLINLDDKVPSPPAPPGADEHRSSQYKSPEGLLKQSQEEESKYANVSDIIC